MEINWIVAVYIWLKYSILEGTGFSYAWKTVDKVNKLTESIVWCKIQLMHKNTVQNISLFFVLKYCTTHVHNILWNMRTNIIICLIILRYIEFKTLLTLTLPIRTVVTYLLLKKYKVSFKIEATLQFQLTRSDQKLHQY